LFWYNVQSKEIVTRGRDWVELEFKGEDLMGGVLRVMILARYIQRSVLSVHLVATMYDEDPNLRNTRRDLTDEEMDEMTACEARRWSSLAYQRQILGGETLEEYLEH